MGEDLDAPAMIDTPDLDPAQDPYPGVGPVAYDTGRPYHPLSEQGLIEGSYGPDVLAEAARRREGGATLREVRRDLGLSGAKDVSDPVLTRAIDEAGRGILTKLLGGARAEPRRYWGGLDPLPTQAEFEAQQARARATDTDTDDDAADPGRRTERR